MNNLLNYNVAYGNNCCMPNTGYGYPFAPLYQYYAYDQLMFNNNWYRPQRVVYNIYGEKEKTFEAKRLRKSGSEYIMTERNGREVNVGRLKVKDKFIVNQHSDGTFDAFYCAVECEDNEVIDISIPYKDFLKRNILPHIPFFRRNADCPDKYITMAFYHEIIDGDDIKFLQLPQHSGWQERQDGKTTFASAEIVIPKLRMYYSDDILERKMLHTEKTLTEAGEALAKVLPVHWKYKFLLVLNVTSVLLYFYRLSGLIPDQMFIIEPKGESNAHTVSAILDNSQRSICRLVDCKTSIQRELALTNDGVALYRDSSYYEEKKHRNVALDTLINDLHEQSRSNAVNRHLTVVIADNLSNISSEIPAYFVSLDDCPDVENNEGISEAIGEFISALVKLLSNSDVTDNLITHMLKSTEFMKKNADNEDYYNSLKMLWATAELLCEYKVFSAEDMEKILFYLRDHINEMPDTDQEITNEVRCIFSDGVYNDSIDVSVKGSSKYFDPTKSMVYIDETYVNALAVTLDTKVLPFMKTTRRRNKMLSATRSCGKLYANNNFKRNIDIEIAPGVTKTFSVYSFTKDILDGKCQNKLKELEYADYTFDKGQEPVGFIPIIKLNSSNKMLGCVINESTDECESMYVSGMSRSGKTRFLVEQAVIRYKSGKKVIVIDQTDAFSPDELEKHGVDKKQFKHWDVGKEGTPVDLLSLENCSTLADKKNRLFSIFAEAASITGEVQGKLLRKKCSSIAKAIDDGTIYSLPDTLRFFDENDPEEAKIHERLAEVFDDLEGLPTANGRWDKLFDSESGIVVISTSRDGIRKKAPLVNMLLADLYEFKLHHRDSRVTIVLDEIEDLNLEKDGPINTILRKGAKHRLSMMLASQEYSVEKDKLGKLIGNCSLHVFFRPKDANIADIAKHIGVDKSVLASLEQGQCVVDGPLFNKIAGKNKQKTVVGWTYMHDE